MNNYPIYQNSAYNPNFTACGRDVCNKIGELIHRNDTCLFRPDLGNWDRFTDYIGNKFKNTEKAHIYNLACSAGDEVYSLIMKLLQKYGEDGASKFFPVLASDYDTKIINMAKKGYLPMYEGDDALINKETGGKFEKYFEKIEEIPDFIKEMDIDFDFLTKVKPVLRDKVNFSVADAAEKCNIIEPNNTIVMARNFWPYLKDESKRIKLSNDLYKSLDTNSAVVLGKFDDEAGAFASKNMYDAGFVCHPEIYTVFEKNKTPNFYI